MGEGGQGRRRWRIVDEGRIRFGKKLAVWRFDEVRALGVEENVAVFRNSFWDLNNEMFPWMEEKMTGRDVVKLLLDHLELT